MWAAIANKSGHHTSRNISPGPSLGVLPVDFDTFDVIANSSTASSCSHWALRTLLHGLHTRAAPPVPRSKRSGRTRESRGVGSDRLGTSSLERPPRVHRFNQLHDLRWVCQEKPNGPTTNMCPSDMARVKDQGLLQTAAQTWSRYLIPRDDLPPLTELLSLSPSLPNN